MPREIVGSDPLASALPLLLQMMQMQEEREQRRADEARDRRMQQAQLDEQKAARRMAEFNQRMNLINGDESLDENGKKEAKRMLYQEFGFAYPGEGKAEPTKDKEPFVKKDRGLFRTIGDKGDETAQDAAQYLWGDMAFTDPEEEQLAQARKLLETGVDPRTPAGGIFGDAPQRKASPRAIAEAKQKLMALGTPSEAVPLQFSEGGLTPLDTQIAQMRDKGIADQDIARALTRIGVEPEEAIALLGGGNSQIVGLGGNGTAGGLGQ